MATQTAEELITDDFIAKIRAGEVSVKDLDASVYGEPSVAALLREKMTAPIPEVEAPVETPVETPVEVPVETPVVVEDDSAARLEAIRKETETFDAEMARLNAILDAPEPEDDLSEGYRIWRKNYDKALREQNALVIGQNKKILTGEIGKLEKNVTSAAEAGYYQSASKIQEEFTILKTAKPYKQAEAAAKSYFNDIVKAHNNGSLENVTQEIQDAAWDRYLSDPEFKKTLAAAPEDFDTVTVIMEARAESAKNRGTLYGNTVEIMNRRGLMGKQKDAWITAGATDAASRTHAALQRRNGEPVPADLGGGKTTASAPSFDGPVTMTSSREHCTAVLVKINGKMASAPRTVSEDDHAQAKICRDRINQLIAQSK